MSTAPKDAALIRKTHPAPTTAVRRPATAGPIMRAALKDAELRATAFDRLPPPTSCDTKVCLAGASKAAVQPSRRAKR